MRVTWVVNYRSKMWCRSVSRWVVGGGVVVVGAEVSR